ncbi:MAG: hypothetical protein ABIE22_01245 [archaeon]
MKVKIIRGRDMPQKLFDMINNQRIKEYGEGINLFERRYHISTLFFFVEDKKSIVAFGFLKNVAMDYQGEGYNIKGIGGIMSVKKERGYGKILVEAMIKYLKKTGKTGLGFCGRKNTKFYEKSGLKSKKDFNKRFVMKNPKTGKLTEDPDDHCDGIYYEGEDKFISKVIKTKSRGYYWFPDIKAPHW